MIRFKLRTLLIAIALVAVFLGSQRYVDNKLTRFAEEIRKTSKENSERLIDDSGLPPTNYMFGGAWVNFEPATFVDVVLVRRRCKVEFASLSPNLEGTICSIEYSIGPFNESSGSVTYR